MTKTAAIIADIHGNICALESVLGEIDRLGIEDIFCLGDICVPVPGGQEVWDLLSRRAIPVIRGNGDTRMAVFKNQPTSSIRFLPTQFTIDRVDKKVIEDLASRPISMELPGTNTILCHGIPDNDYDFLIYEDGGLNPAVKKWPGCNIIAGHSHHVREHFADGNYYCTVGSVGIPFLDGPLTQFLVITYGTDWVDAEHQTVPYDRQKMVDLMVQKDFLSHTGPVGLLAFDEILSSAPRLMPFFEQFCDGKPPADDKLTHKVLSYLDSIGRLDEVNRYRELPKKQIRQINHLV